MPLVQKQRWLSNRAVLFIHGVGDSKPGDYSRLVDRFQEILGDDARKFAIYFLYYDQLNEWFSDKVQAGIAFTKLVNCIGEKLPGTNLGNSAAAFAGDVIWPVLVPDARLAVRSAVLAQLHQIVLDGIAANVQPRAQRVSVIAHSMGCFHVYEALTHAARTPSEGLGPASQGIVLDNLMLMASPVQLIRTVARELGAAVPQRASIYSVSQPSLEIPNEEGDAGQPVNCAARVVSITGDLDPIGGFFLRNRTPWGYMDLDGQQAFVDQEQIGILDGPVELELANVLQRALRDGAFPAIAPDNPHDWSAYLARHADHLREWLV